MSAERRFWVMDAETIINCSVFVFVDYHSDEEHIFRINREINEFPQMLEFLDMNIENKDWHFGYNNLNFDSQIIEQLLKDRYKLLKYSALDLSHYIYEYAQYVIQKKNNNEFLDFAPWNLTINVLDVFKINHWDNANKRCALKWLQYTMDWENIEEMPHDFRDPVLTDEVLDEVVSYCQNDVYSTKKAFDLSKAAVNLRSTIQRSYGLQCMNFSNTKIGSELLLELYCHNTGKNKRDVKHLRTPREFIELKKVIFPYIKFNTPIFQDFLTKLKAQVIHGTKKAFSEVVDFMGYEFHYGLGGIHQCISKGIYSSDDEWIIIDADVASLYPSIAVVNKMYPEHLGPDFFKVYKNDIVDVRLAEKKKKPEDKNMAIIDGFKEAANASYGNSNSQYSWLYDSEYTMRTTVNGQLMLSMLVEDLLVGLEGSTLLQTNTDGLTMRIRRSDVDRYYEICKEWEKTTNLILEYAEYSKMFIWDVNNYIALYTDGKTKCKGRFEWEPFDKYKASHLHKNKSHLIIAKAIYNHFINGIKPEEYLKVNRNIYDYCAGIKLRGKWYFEEHAVVNGEIVNNVHKKILRYYISKRGCKLIKKHPDGRVIQAESGKYLQTVMNQYVKCEWEQYDVDTSYYLKKIYDEIYAIDKDSAPHRQLNLF